MIISSNFRTALKVRTHISENSEAVQKLAVKKIKITAGADNTVAHKKQAVEETDVQALYLAMGNAVWLTPAFPAALSTTAVQGASA